MPAPFCKHCIYWEKDIIDRGGDKFGICDNVLVPPSLLVDTKTEVNETETVYTEQWFGCIYFSEGNALIDLSEL